MKKILRDVPLGTFMIIGMVLVFFLVFNVIGLINDFKMEQEESMDSQYEYEHKLYVRYPPQFFLLRSKENIDKKFDVFDVKTSHEYMEEMLKVCSKYTGNVTFNYYTMSNYNGSMDMSVYLNMNEPLDIRLADGSVITVDRMEDLEKGVYINKDDEYKIVKNNDKDYVWVENQLVEVEGIFKGPSDFIWSMEALGENLTESLYRNSQAISEGSDPMIFSFYSNDKETEKVYENIKKELADNYYQVNEYEDIDVKKPYYYAIYKSILGKITVVLGVFALINCIFISNLWMKRRQSELMIRKAYGQRIFSIFRILVFEFFKLEIIAVCIACLIQYVYRCITKEVGIYITPSFEGAVVLLIAISVTTFIIMIPQLIRLIFIRPATGIKEV